MRAIQFEDSIPNYLITKVLGKLHTPSYYGPLSCLRVRDVKPPVLPGPKWARVKVRYGGICGSDISLIRLHDSTSLSPFGSFPFTIGHENVGVLTEVGEGLTGFEIGNRVIAEPLLPCVTRGIDPVCPQCAQGQYSRCINFAEGNIAAGTILGACRDTGGSWSSEFVAHEFQLFRVPNDVSDENALLVDAFCSSLHPVMRNRPTDDQTVLILGSGIIGIFAVAAIRALGSRARIVVVAKYPFQGELAKHYGADEVIYLRDGDLYEGVAARTGGRLYKPILGKRVMMGGPDIVYECVGTDNGLDDAIRFAREGGKVVVVGLAGVVKNVDWTPIWFRELTVTGAYCYAVEEYAGESKRAYQIALDWLAEGKLDLSPALTHRFRLEDWKQALQMLMTRKSGNKMIKAVFEFPV